MSDPVSDPVSDPGDGFPLADEPLSWPVVDSDDLHRDDWVVAFRTDTIHRPEAAGEQLQRLGRRRDGDCPMFCV